MKLKYYLRGLGIGMLVAALVLILSGKTGEGMSDEAVKRRAAELGMVEKDKTVLSDIGDGAAAGEDAEEGNLSKTPDAGTDFALPEGEGQNSAETPGDGEAMQSELPEEQNEATQESLGEQSEASPEETEEQALAREIEQKADEVADRAKEVAENSVPENTITLEVRRGDSSVSVARRAAEAGLVQSAADFDVFLCQNGYDKRISIGSYEIAVGASEKEIADTITKSN